MNAEQGLDLLYKCSRELQCKAEIHDKCREAVVAIKNELKGLKELNAKKKPDKGTN